MSILAFICCKDNYASPAKCMVNSTSYVTSPTICSSLPSLNEQNNTNGQRNDHLHGYLHIDSTTHISQEYRDALRHFSVELALHGYCEGKHPHTIWLPSSANNAQQRPPIRYLSDEQREPDEQHQTTILSLMRNS